MSANDVPSDGAVVGLVADAVESFEKRDCMDDMFGLLVGPAPSVVARDSADVLEGLEFSPMPSPGTDIPAEPSLSSAPWFMYPCCDGWFLDPPNVFVCGF